MAKICPGFIINVPATSGPLALLLIDTNDPKRLDDHVWSWAEWQQITGYTLPPCHPQFDASAPASDVIFEQEHLAVISFIKNFRITDSAIKMPSS
jgi:hypothetical protein